MADQAPEIYGLEFQSRALTARVGEQDKIQFLCGTLTIRNENQIHLVDFDEETNILNKMMFPHPAGEIWDISCCYGDRDLLSVCHGCVEEGQYVQRSSLLRIEGGDEPDQTDQGTLKTIGGFQSPNNTQRSAWHPGGSHDQIVTIDDKSYMKLWTVNGSVPQEMSTIQLDPKGRVRHSDICWSSQHNYSQLLIAADSALYSWDIRNNKCNQLLDHHHGSCVRGIDCNPNRPYYFVSCGDDCTIQFWDWRKLATPLVIRQDHSHWVWSVQYNLFHDQLILSGSSDSQVLLTKVESVASEPLQHMDDEDNTPRPPVDEIIARYEEHEDSVYGVQWSSSDAWVFASLSYDGRVVINHVPSKEKFSILTS